MTKLHEDDEGLWWARYAVRSVSGSGSATRYFRTLDGALEAWSAERRSIRAALDRDPRLRGGCEEVHLIVDMSKLKVDTDFLDIGWEEIP